MVISGNSGIALFIRSFIDTCLDFEQHFGQQLLFLNVLYK